MPKRGSLAGLIESAEKDAAELPSAPPLAPAPAAAGTGPELTKGSRPRQPRAGRPGSQTPEVRSSEVQSPVLPKYKRLERKEALLWPDQLNDLSLARRMLNRQRAGAGERITENTLIRVAVALLLSRSDELSGTTEDELRSSLGLR